MKSKITFLFIFAIAIASCKKTTNVDVSINNSGKLSYKLLDDAGKGLPNVKVQLYDNINVYYNTPVLLETRTTDQNGIIDFGELNPSTYQLVPDSPQVNKVKYHFSEYVQVTAGSTKQKDTKVSDYSGTLNIIARSYYPGNTPLRNLGVLLVPYSKYNYSNNLSSNISNADFKGVTDNNGLISFKIPSTTSYSILLYNTSTNAYINAFSSFTVEKDANYNLPVVWYYN
jgi:hypothetical protein